MQSKFVCKLTAHRIGWLTVVENSCFRIVVFLVQLTCRRRIFLVPHIWEAEFWPTELIRLSVRWMQMGSVDYTCRIFNLVSFSTI